MNNDVIFSRYLLREVLKGLKAYCLKNSLDYKELIKNSWGYSYKGNMGIEFHINKCSACSNGFYWHGQGKGLTLAKANGFIAYLEVLNTKGKAL